MSLRWIAVLVAAAVVVLDQLTKAWATAALADGPIVLMDGVLQFRLTRNTGAAFSLLSRNGPLLGLIAVGVVIVIFVALRDAGHRLDAVALGLVLGGAIGNLLDRFFRGDALLDGAVVDFIDPSFFATFNVADSAITIGVALLLLSVVIRR